MIGEQQKIIVKVSSILAFTGLFCCGFTLLVLTLEEIDCINDQYCEDRQLSAAVVFLLTSSKAIGGILASYKHSFISILMIASLIAWDFQSEVSTLVAFGSASRNVYWKLLVATTIVNGLCFIFACTFAYFIKRETVKQLLGERNGKGLQIESTP